MISGWGAAQNPQARDVSRSGRAQRLDEVAIFLLLRPQWVAKGRQAAVVVPELQEVVGDGLVGFGK